MSHNADRRYTQFGIVSGAITRPARYRCARVFGDWPARCVAPGRSDGASGALTDARPVT
ncbi:hypothetical protein HKCCSP123_04725 [Rhodobacterales bacterium HKCCSP123]|nr:hypothetical protein [Rhodobacterales bacterium HKCCSP123]